MLPRTHHFFIEQAALHAGGWAMVALPELFSGNDDEDVSIVPFFGWRLRAAGLTHTQRPGRSRGELGFPSAKARCVFFLEQARRTADPSRAMQLVGHACHLLGDAAVPARANGVWHIEGDPLEAWIEEHLDKYRKIVEPTVPAAEPGELVEGLSKMAAGFGADTTRTPWGRAAHRWLGRGVVLSEGELEAQADVLVPAAIGHTAALLRRAERAGIQAPSSSSSS